MLWFWKGFAEEIHFVNGINGRMGLGGCDLMEGVGEAFPGLREQHGRRLRARAGERKLNSSHLLRNGVNSQSLLKCKLKTVRGIFKLDIYSDRMEIILIQGQQL